MLIILIFSTLIDTSASSLHFAKKFLLIPVISRADKLADSKLSDSEKASGPKLITFAPNVNEVIPDL